MEPENKIKVSVVIKFVSDKESEEPIIGLENDKKLSLQQILSTLNSIKNQKEEENKETLISLLKGFKHANEVMADSFINIERDDLFDDKYKTIEIVDSIINQIAKL